MSRDHLCLASDVYLPPFLLSSLRCCGLTTFHMPVLLKCLASTVSVSQSTMSSLHCVCLTICICLASAVFCLKIWHVRSHKAPVPHSASVSQSAMSVLYCIYLTNCNLWPPLCLCHNLQCLSSAFSVSHSAMSGLLCVCLSHHPIWSPEETGL